MNPSPAIADALTAQDEVGMVTATLTAYEYLDGNGDRCWGLVAPEGQSALASHSMASLALRITDGWVNDLMYGGDGE